MLIDNEPIKALQNLKWIGLFLESFRGQMLSKNKVQWLDLPFHLCPRLVGLPLVKRFEFIMTLWQIFKASFKFFIKKIFLVPLVYVYI